MKRRILKLALFLLLGAIINVAVAWTCAVTIDSSEAFVQLAHGDAISPLLWTWSRFGAQRAILLREQGLTKINENDRPAFEELSPRWSNLEADLTRKLDLDGSGIEHVCADGRGLPMISMWSEQRQVGIRFPRSRSAFHFGGIDIGMTEEVWADMSVKPLLPLRPIWPGFAINTVFYAATLWLLFGLPFALRRRRRIKRGLCPACAYPVGASDVCTECGKAVRT